MEWCTSVCVCVYVCTCDYFSDHVVIITYIIHTTRFPNLACDGFQRGRPVDAERGWSVPGWRARW